MQKPYQSNFTSEAMDLLSTLLLSPAAGISSKVSLLQEMSSEQFSTFLALAHSNHVVIRGMEVYRSLMLAANDLQGARAAEDVLVAEHSRIAGATSHLRVICDACAEAGLDVTVMKTLDHWPDFGSDIDLYTSASPAAVCDLMQKQFRATIASRSWGDRLAGKWNFYIPGLPEAVEIHMCRLGQTGEQLTLAANIPARSRILQFGGYRFRVPSASDRIMISTLQRMYRHFYFRLCDILDSAALAQSGELDYADLEDSAKACGIWEGVATYLVLVSDYVRRYSGSDISLPSFVKAAGKSASMGQ